MAAKGKRREGEGCVCDVAGVAARVSWRIFIFVEGRKAFFITLPKRKWQINCTNTRVHTSHSAPSLSFPLSLLLSLSFSSLYLSVRLYSFIHYTVQAPRLPFCQSHCSSLSQTWKSFWALNTLMGIRQYTHWLGKWMSVWVIGIIVRGRRILNRSSNDWSRRCKQLLKLLRLYEIYNRRLSIYTI